MLLKANEHTEKFCISSERGNGMFCVMLDCSRNAVLNINTVKNYIKTIAYLGYNTLMLYTEDTYLVENEPYFGYMRGAYSEEELNQIVEYGNKYGVEIVPCIQTLAHLNQIFRWEDYKLINDCEDILLIDDERTYELIENMLVSLRKSFKTDKINIGMDEAMLVGMGKYFQRNGYCDRTKMLLNHLSKVITLCAKYNFTKPLMWSDMFLRLSFNNEYYIDCDIPKNLKNIIPKNIGLIYWDYYSVDSQRYDSLIKKHAELSDNIYFAGGAWKWSGFSPFNEFSIKATTAAFEALNKHNVEHVIITAWGDHGSESSCFSILPVLIAASNLYFNTSLDNNDSICTILTGINFQKFITATNANIKRDNQCVEELSNNSKFLFYNDLLIGLFDAMVQKGYNEKFLELTKKIKESSNGPYHYVFKTLESLAEVLSVKAELGVKITQNYRAKNIGGLKENINDIKKTIFLIEKFYNNFKYQWYLENKSFGFEIHDIRIGGLIFRLKETIKRLKLFINGKIEKIEELETERLNPCAKKNEVQKEATEIVFNRYPLIVSANNIV